jgi:hypothetical protein
MTIMTVPDAAIVMLSVIVRAETEAMTA